MQQHQAQQGQLMQQNTQLVAAMMRRKDLEGKRREKAEEKAREDAKREALLTAKTSDPFTAAQAKAAATPGTGSVSGAGPGASSTDPSVGSRWAVVA